MGMLRRLRLSVVLAAVFVPIFLPAQSVRAAVITVTTTAESPGATGDCTLGEAIQAANTDGAVDTCAAGSGADSIVLVAGTYALMTGVTTPFGASAFQITTPVAILGNGATLTRDPVNANLRLFEVASAGILTVSNLTLSNGRALGSNGVGGLPGGSGLGGAIYNGGTLALSAVGLMGNQAQGGVGSPGSPGRDSGSEGGWGLGGAIYNAGQLTLTTVTLTNNSAQGGRGGTASGFGIGGPGGVGQGGALYHEGTSTTTLNIADSTLADNRAVGGPNGPASPFVSFGYPAGDASGGALHGEGLEGGAATVVVAHSSLTANEAVGGSTPEGPGLPGQGVGGAISMSAVSLTLTHSTVSGNAARGGAVDAGGDGLGGGLHVQYADIDVRRTAIVENAAVGGQGWEGKGTSHGGGLYARTVQASLTNVTVSDNDAEDGGGGAHIVGAGNLALNHVTLANNISATGAGGVVAASAATATFAGTVVVNKRFGSSLVNCSGVVANLGGNLQFPGTTCGAGIPVADPQLGPLQEEGGTMVNPVPAGSPAVDAADQAGCPATDQRGVTRPIDGDDDGLSVCDVGAYEAVPDDVIFADGFDT